MPTPDPLKNLATIQTRAGEILRNLERLDLGFPDEAESKRKSAEAMANEIESHLVKSLLHVQRNVADIRLKFARYAETVSDVIELEQRVRAASGFFMAIPLKKSNNLRNFPDPTSDVSPEECAEAFVSIMQGMCRIYAQMAASDAKEALNWATNVERQREKGLLSIGLQTRSLASEGWISPKEAKSLQSLIEKFRNRAASKPVREKPGRPADKYKTLAQHTLIRELRWMGISPPHFTVKHTVCFAIGIGATAPYKLDFETLRKLEPDDALLRREGLFRLPQHS